MEITKNNQGSCVWCQAQSAAVLDQTEGNSVPYSPQSLELQPYFHTDSSSLEH
uniref:Serine/threonine-protein phosphatase n=1 Tax=Rhizophora mucronata TaxID=61149 RepID=A0A2P2MML8_RHIMU